MTDRDPRWANVTGGIEPHPTYPGVRQLVLEIRSHGHVVGHAYMLTGTPDELARVLPKMVRAIDKALHA